MTGDVETGLDALATGASVALIKSGKVLATATGGGVAPFVEAATTAGKSTVGSTLVDRVVGRAVALLALYFGVTRVHGLVMSRPAYQLLAEAGLRVTSEELVEHILRRDGNGICPMEEMAMAIDSPTKAWDVISERLGH